MAMPRPAGFSSDEDDSDDYGYYEKPIRNYNYVQQNDGRNLESELENSIINNDINLVENIIKNDLNNNVDYRLKSGWTPLMHACFHAKDNIVQFLLSRGADPNLHSDSVMPIMVSCSNSTGSNDAICNIIKNLVEKKCFLNVGDKFGQTPLMRAISSGRTPVVTLLLNNNVNIESRDNQGWTAIFWAVHHNKLEILKVLIEHGARVTEVDRNNRTLYDIANSHGYEEIITFLDEYLDKNDTDIDCSYEAVTQWFDFYPGIKSNERLTYTSEIPHLLYGMNCERLTPTICNNMRDLRSFLVMNEEDMITIGIDMPYERQRLNHGLRNFHKRKWNVKSISGLYARTNESYGVIDCLTSLGSHLQQIYIIEATLQYTLNQYSKIQNELKCEPPDSPLLSKLHDASRKLLKDICDIKTEMKILKRLLSEISKENHQPIHLIKDKSSLEVILSYVPSVFIICSLAAFTYAVKNPIKAFLNK